MSATSFHGLAVLTLESRRAAELATIISRLDGHPVSAPAMREVPLRAQTDAVAFIDAAIAGGFDCVVFLTGVGARALITVATEHGARRPFLEALTRTHVVVRGPKPLAALREVEVPVWVVAPEPNTWREVVAAIDAHESGFSLTGARVAVQEYGVSNEDLLQALTDRGAVVTAVPIYQWALPDDLEPLRSAVRAVGRGEIDVIVLTSGVQLAHLWRIAREMGEEDQLRGGLRRAVIASIGPTTSDEIRRRGLEPDLEASHPKMGMLVTEAAAQAAGILAQKRARVEPGS